MLFVSSKKLFSFSRYSNFCDFFYGKDLQKKIISQTIGPSTKVAKWSRIYEKELFFQDGTCSQGPAGAISQIWTYYISFFFPNFTKSKKILRTIGLKPMEKELPIILIYLVNWANIRHWPIFLNITKQDMFQKTVIYGNIYSKLNVSYILNSYNYDLI